MVLLAVAFPVFEKNFGVKLVFLVLLLMVLATHVISIVFACGFGWAVYGKGASGVVFLALILASWVHMRPGKITCSVILVVIFWIMKEVCVVFLIWVAAR